MRGIEPLSPRPKRGTLSVELQGLLFLPDLALSCIIYSYMLKISDLISKGLIKIISPVNSANPIVSGNSFKPFITVSRESGSGGAPIAKMVAGSLGFELYDEKFVEAIAKSAKKRTELIKSVDEKARGLVTDVLQSVLNPNTFQT